MYEGFFHLQRRPFSATPDISCFYATPSVQESLTELTLKMQQGQGIGILTAPPGMGKTLVCRKLITHLRDTLTPVFLGTAGFPTRRALLQAILFELGQRYTGLDENELRLELLATLRKLVHQGRGLLLVIDEAHLLSDRLLEEVRSLATLEEEGQPLARCVLCGQVALEERLISPQLDSLNQRVVCHVYLDHFNREQSLEYIAYRLDWAEGERGDLFTLEALEWIAHASNGVPRCLNQLCDHSLLLAFVSEQPQVSREIVEDALTDLRQLPLHWNDILPAASTDEHSGETASAAAMDAAETLFAAPEDNFGGEGSEFGAPQAGGSRCSPGEREFEENCDCDELLDEVLSLDDDFEHRDLSRAETTTASPDTHTAAFANTPLPQSASFEVGADSPPSVSAAALAGGEPSALPGKGVPSSTSPASRATTAPAQTPMAPTMHHDDPLYFADSCSGPAGVVPISYGRRSTLNTCFEEELVEDRYTAIDAGLPVPPRSSSTKLVTGPTVFSGLEASFEERVTGDINLSVKSTLKVKFVEEVEPELPQELATVAFPTARTETVETQLEGPGSSLSSPEISTFMPNLSQFTPHSETFISRDEVTEMPAKTLGVRSQATGSILELVDTLLPLVGSANSIEIRPAEIEPALRLDTNFGDGEASTEEIEEAIGSEVLDVCLEVQQSLMERLDTDDPSLRSSGRVTTGGMESLEASSFEGFTSSAQYDVIEPEVATRVQPQPATRKLRADTGSTSDLPPRPNYKWVFSQLRRQQNRRPSR